MAQTPGVIRDARLVDGRRVDVLLDGSRITAVPPAGVTAEAHGPALDAGGRLLLPSLVEGHVHLDKTFLGCAWQPHRPGGTVAERIQAEKQARAAVREPVAVRGARLIERLVERGAGFIRSHVDIDPECRLDNVEALLELRERYAGQVTIQLVAFPQSGILRAAGTAELMAEALRLGCEIVGGLDPAGIDGDPLRSLDVVFDLAARHGSGVDIHLHDPGELGCFELRAVAERTAALGLGGEVTVSHAYALGEVGPVSFAATAEALARAGVAIMTSAPGRLMPPVAALQKRGVLVFAGSDNIRDAWSPHGNGDPLERAMFVAYRQEWHLDEELERAFDLVTRDAARAVGAGDPGTYGVAVGSAADLMLIDAQTVAEAVAQRPPARTVLKNGRIVAG